MAKNSVPVTVRFAAYFNQELQKFSPVILDKLIARKSQIDANRKVLRSIESETVWVSRDGSIAETLTETESSATVEITRGKSAGQFVNLWTSVDVLDYAGELRDSGVKIQKQIDEIRAIGTDETVKVERKARTAKYPHAVSVRFIPTMVAIPELDSNERATRLYNANAEIIGYNLVSKARAAKSE